MKTVLSLALVAAFMAVPSYAACTYPKGPTKFPDGNTATVEEMRASLAEVRAFDAAITEYQKCLETEYNEAVSALPEMTPEQKKEREKIHTMKINQSAVDAETAANAINTQVKVWREKNTPPSQNK